MESEARSSWRIIHGSAFIALLAAAMLVPALRQWPWIWIVPMAGYFLMPIFVPKLRGSRVWFRLGRVSGISMAATVGIMTLTSLVLVAFNAIAKPDLGAYRGALPLERFGGVIAAGVVFTIVNATLEELVFRGVLFDAIRSQWNVWVTLIATSVLFGLGHLHGYPPGTWGAGLAIVFGFAVGLLRVWTGGLSLPIVAHMGADATIYWILVGGGAV
jgi:membrane protease YdiL (CAAX protease family)